MKARRHGTVRQFQDPCYTFALMTLPSLSHPLLDRHSFSVSIFVSGFVTITAVVIVDIGHCEPMYRSFDVLACPHCLFKSIMYNLNATRPSTAFSTPPSQDGRKWLNINLLL